MCLARLERPRLTHKLRCAGCVFGTLARSYGGDVESAPVARRSGSVPGAVDAVDADFLGEVMWQTFIKCRH